MPRAIRFHLDEHCHRAIAEGLRRRGVDVTTTPEIHLQGASDADHIAYAVAEGRVIFTQDRDFLRLHAAGMPHPGIAYADKDTKSIGDIIRGLVLLWEVLEPDEMLNRVEFL
jgi:predicted nuclease of predicted toxin-antitoxin system